MEYKCVCLLWILAVFVWKSSCQCVCSGFLTSSQFGELTFEYDEQRPLSLVAGFAYDIVCSDNNVEPTWSYQGQMVSDSSSSATTYQISEAANHKTLKFSSFSADEIGEYTCTTCTNCTLDIKAGNPVVNLDDHSATRQITTAKKINLFYILMGEPTPTSEDVTWTHNGSPLNPDLGVLSIEGGLILFPPFTSEHEGDYTIHVTTSAGSGTDSFNLNLDFFPIVDLSVECSDGCDQASDNNDSYILVPDTLITIMCSNTVSTDLDTLKFTWKKDDQPLTEDRYTVTDVSPGVSSLMFQIVNFTDTGSYECFVQNIIGSYSTNVHFNILNAPVISGISPEQITWVSGNDGKILVLFEGGFPEPNVTWIRRRIVKDSFEQEILLADDNHFLFSGIHLLNLTMTHVTLDDIGNYSIRVSNYLGNLTLWFSVDVIVPPRLEPITEMPLFLATGSEVTLEVAIFDAFPLVVKDDITWSPSGDEETFNGSHTTVTLRDVSPGNPSEVTVTVTHPAQNVNHTFQLTVLDPSDSPINFTVIKQNTCQVFFIWQTAVPDSNITAATDSVGLEYREGISDQWKELGHSRYLVNESEILPLKPEVMYTFRAYSWSDSIGRGGETMEEQFDTMTANPQIIVKSLMVNGKNSSSIAVTWNSPPHDSNCYTIFGYELICNNSVDGIIIANATIKAVTTPPDHTYSMPITGLLPDRSFVCTLSVLGNDSAGDPIPNTMPYSVHGSTLPRPPPEPPIPSASPGGDSGVSSNAGMVTLDLSTLQDLPPTDASHIWIAVLRLGVSPTLPSQLPDVMYPTAASFSDSFEVGSPSASSSNGQYKPYIASEFDVKSIPPRFVVGSESDAVRSYVGRQAIQVYNGPLETNDHYTFFIRAFSPSTLSPEKQYVVFKSSGYVTPIKPDSGSSSVDGGLAGGVIAVVTIFCILVIAAVVIAVVVGLFIWYHFKRDKDSTQRHGENGDLKAKENDSDIQLKHYINNAAVADDNEYIERENYKPPLDVSSKENSALENHHHQPLSFPNPHYDHLTPEAGQLTPSQLSSSVSASPRTPEKQFFEEPEESPKLKRFSLSSSISNNGSEEFDDTENTRILEASERIHRDKFQEYVDGLDAENQKGFKEGFKYIQDHSEDYPAEASREAQPFTKNRYRDIVAFDHTRVKLNPMHNVPHSDYINANFVKGYDDNKLYIATQGPMYETHCDFWRMVWEQKSTTIVMLTKVFEADRHKCFKYWPEVEEKSRAYGDFVVRQDQNISLPYYTIRSFKIVPVIGSSKERTVLQFHYTDWPDRNVPALASSLLDFLRAINSSNNDVEQVPIVVHCSAGVGRTGTIIALDMCLDQLQNEKTVDVRGVVAFLREQRSQMIQVLPQYIFLHHAVLEAIVYGDSSVMLKEFPNHFKYLQTDSCKPISEEFDKIGKIKPPAQASSGPDTVELASTNPLSGQHMLFTAHYVDGYWEKRKFIVCEHPSTETISQFWQLVWDKKCSAIIMITPNDSQNFGYLHEVDQESVFGNLRVKVEKQQARAGFISRSIVITNDFDGSKFCVRHMEYECWVSSRHFNIPSFVKFVNEAVNQAELLDALKQPILVHDDDVCGSAGALVTLVYCFQRLKQERIIDLLQAVNRLHLQCPDLIRSLQLYGFCYDCLQEFTTKLLREDSVPPIYENIASIRGRIQAVSPPPPDPQAELISSYDII